MALFFPQVSLLPLERYTALLGPHRMQEVALRVAELRARLSGRVVWNVSSSHVGGGVAEMVRTLLAYARGADVDARWAILKGTPDFFRITKRIHNAIHGTAGDDSPLERHERQIYERVTHECAVQLSPLVRPHDIVIIHDPQPAGMIDALAQCGASIVWRCHIGSDQVNPESQRGWEFLSPYLSQASAFVFSRAAYIPPQIDSSRAVIIPPSIDPFSAKNQIIEPSAIRAILIRSGILSGAAGDELPIFLRENGTPGRVERFAEVLTDGRLPTWETPIIVQVSRWDRLKDPIGVIRGFSLVQSNSATSAHLLIVGPATRSVADDPEDAWMYRETVAVWRSLARSTRERVHLVSLPTADVEENAAIVNAIQRHATLVIQKSLHEGFGLTVAEAMWKGRPVVASAVGGIQDQREDGVQGLLLEDPYDLHRFASAIDRILEDLQLAAKMGAKGRERVLERYLGVDSLLRYGSLIESIDGSARQNGLEAG